VEVGGLIVVQGEQVAEGVPVSQEHEDLLGRAVRWMEQASSSLQLAPPPDSSS
jgi:hypothetical protein